MIWFWLSKCFKVASYHIKSIFLSVCQWIVVVIIGGSLMNCLCWLKNFFFHTKMVPLMPMNVFFLSQFDLETEFNLWKCFLLGISQVILYVMNTASVFPEVPFMYNSVNSPVNNFRVWWISPQNSCLESLPACKVLIKLISSCCLVTASSWRYVINFMLSWCLDINLASSCWHGYGITLTTWRY